jgi:hypothetical protein
VEAEAAVGELPVQRHGLHGHPRPLPLVRPQPEERRPLVVRRLLVVRRPLLVVRRPLEERRPPLEDLRPFRPGRLLPEDPPEVVVEGVG